MRSSLIGWQQQPAGPLTEARQALEYGSGSPRTLLTYTPVARMNPYQALIYSAFSEKGIATSEIIPAARVSALPSIRDIAENFVLHLHWPSFFIAGADSEDAADKKVDSALAQLDELKKNDIHILFTLHNKISHDAKYLDSEVRLQQEILDRANTIHSMSFAALDSMEAFARVPREKVIVAPHPTYENVYPTFLSREECRKSLGISPDEVAFSLFGALKGYKGLSRLQKVWPSIVRASDRRLRLVVAGQPDDSAEAREFVEWAFNEPSVLIQPAKIPFEQVQVYVKSCDVGLAPYDRTLNSGAAMLYLTFGLPVVLPREKSLTEDLPENSYVTFSTDAEMITAFQEAARKADAGRNFDLTSREPKRVSALLATQLLERL